ncbi:YdcF family protein [Oharaeibacter diazotrophicus]|uniref:Uncharacterized SAM-binding protein YcdF (DUF218 family) n=1 Tax=Oharaeibacter diazotrophicus TaxID=1920512 RepID=A0A4R6RKZ9_9HYPH|nr:YdcF family protein [Oharaeibacter diazotrophicus]TDP86637.1 uncharacterized SAM-binding protein YcdF (DUF218 family) [Oharaeibacter diazotrophicus]BBE71421.1 hypothetical protein OHA_1_00995 [Pleomorphomonas sp. SM30]GLS78180.1 membrane protein [Oharaeibacter diazotrophicus]
MFYLLSKLAFLAVRPSNAVILAMLIGLVARGTRFRKFGTRLGLFGLFALVVFAWTGAGDVLINPLERRFPFPELGDTPPTGIIVLGGVLDPWSTRMHHTPQTIDGAERIAAGIDLARRYPSARLVYSGGTADAPPALEPEADIVGRMFAEAGIAPDRVVLEKRSLNTRENALFSYDLVGPRSGERWIVVTSAFHMPRAIGCLRAAGWTGLVAYPVDYRGDPLPDIVDLKSASESLLRTDLAVKEWIGLVVYRFGGFTDALFPAP